MPTPYAVSSDLVSAWPAKSLAVANYLDSALAAKYDNAPAINAQVGTTYTFVLADATAGKTITASNAAASTYTVPPQSSVAFSAGALLRVTNIGAGVVTFAGGSGVTVTNTAGTLAQYQTATLVRTGSDAWTVIPFGGGAGMSLVATATVSAASSLSINNCFTSAAQAYRVVISGTGSGTGENNLNMRLRVGGVDATAANYARIHVYATTGAGPTLSGSAGATLGIVGYASSAWWQTSFDITNPAAAAPTGVTGIGVSNGSSTGNAYFSVIHTLSTAYDGITIYPDAITITATARIYAYKNS